MQSKEIEKKEEKETRGNSFERFITSIIILCNPSLYRKDYKIIMYDYIDKLIFIKKRMKLIL